MWQLSLASWVSLLNPVQWVLPECPLLGGDWGRALAHGGRQLTGSGGDVRVEVSL